MTQAEIGKQVWAFLQENFLYMRPNLKVDPDYSLLRAGVMDSLGVMEVIGFLEQTYGFKVADGEITEANLGTLNAIARFVAAKLGATTSGAGPST